MYPLLEDDSCYFLAVDFDEAEWRNDSRAFNRSAVGFFIAHKLLRLCKCPMFALHYNIPQCLPPTRSL